MKKKTFKEIEANQFTNCKFILQHIYSGVTRGRWPLLCDKYITIIVYFLIQGSMNGHRIQRAKETLLLLLKSLPVECFFNVVSFGSSHSSLFDQ